MRAAAAYTDVTPLRSAPLAGFRGRDQLYVGVDMPLEANAVAFRADGDRRALILTLDALFVGPRLHAELTDHFVRGHGQKADDLLLVASHTHFAPSVDDTKPALGSADTDYVGHVASRCRQLIDAVLGAADVEVGVQCGTGTTGAAINRRRPWPLPYFSEGGIMRPEVVMAPNPQAPLDPTIRTWLVADRAGRPVVLLWHFACHPTAFPRRLHVSPDFPGKVRQVLRERYGSALPVLYLQGFAGDIRPRAPETRAFWRRAAETIVLGPTFDSFTPESWLRWAEGLANDVAQSFKSPTNCPLAAETGSAISSASHAVPLSEIVNGERPDRMIRFQRLRIRQAFDLVAVAAEPLTGMRAMVPFPGATALGYLGDVFGYWPTDEDAQRGGYEVRHFLPVFGLTGRLRGSLDARFRAGVDALRVPQ